MQTVSRAYRFFHFVYLYNLSLHRNPGTHKHKVESLGWSEKKTFLNPTRLSGVFLGSCDSSLKMCLNQQHHLSLIRFSYCTFCNFMIFPLWLLSKYSTPLKLYSPLTPVIVIIITIWQNRHGSRATYNNHHYCKMHYRLNTRVTLATTPCSGLATVN